MYENQPFVPQYADKLVDISDYTPQCRVKLSDFVECYPHSRKIANLLCKRVFNELIDHGIVEFLGVVKFQEADVATGDCQAVHVSSAQGEVVMSCVKPLCIFVPEIRKTRGVT